MACDDAVSPKRPARGLCGMPGASRRKDLILRSMALAQAASGAFVRLRCVWLRFWMRIVPRLRTQTRRRVQPGNPLFRSWQDSPSSVSSASQGRRGWLRFVMLTFALRPVPQSQRVGAVFQSDVQSRWSRMTRTPLPQVDPAKAVAERQPVRIVQATLQDHDRPAHRTWQHPAPAVAVPSKLPQQRTANLIHQTSLTTANPAPVAFTETFFVIVEGSDPGFPIGRYFRSSCGV